MAENKEISIKMFDVISVIGRGAYAKVLLARCLLDDCVYAVKVLKKQYILEKNQEKQIMTEKEILAKI
jgi:serine/threonine protein kinase